MVSLLQPLANSPDGDIALNMRGALSVGHRHGWDELKRGITGTDFQQEHPPGGVFNSHIPAFAQVFIRRQQEVKLSLWLSG